MKKTLDTIQYIIVIAIFLVGIALALMYTTDNPRYDLILVEYSQLVDAFIATVFISITTLILSMVIGFVMFLMLRSKIVFIRAFSQVFNEIIMGTPLLVLIFLAVYVIGTLINVDDKILLGILSLTLYTSPYIANAYETAVAVVDSDQYVVMDLYHFKWYQKYRYVIIPQMIKPVIPSIINNLSSIIKGSALLKIISVFEISYVVGTISSRNWAAIEGYYVMWVMYLIITIPLSLLAKYIGKRVSA